MGKPFIVKMQPSICPINFKNEVSASLLPMKLQHAGFTLVELMVTLAIVVLLASLAVPGFQTMLVGRRLESAINTLASDFRFARVEAVKRTARVSICASSDGTSCTGLNSVWKNGWIVFVDDDGDGTFESGDEIVRVQDAFPGIASIASASPGSDRNSFVFQPTGWSQAASQTFWITPNGNSGVAARLVCISNKGRAAIRAKGDTSCS
ncbi:MAG: GspH/FimT family pseudopilin [Comamonadaceae bacterium]|nr:GspH/FimT family pseudopilin [Comamonadaceae bacterium]